MARQRASPKLTPSTHTLAQKGRREWPVVAKGGNQSLLRELEPLEREMCKKS